MERNLKDLGQKYSRESRKQDTVGASKNRDTEGQGCLTGMDNRMCDELSLSLPRVKT